MQARPVGSIGAGRGGGGGATARPLGSYTTNLHLQICKLTSGSSNCIALQSAPKWVWSQKAQEFFLQLPPWLKLLATALACMLIPACRKV